MTEEYIKQAKKSKREKDYIRAADFFYLAGDYQSALEMYLKAENYELAAKLSEDLKEYENAIEFNQKAQNYLRAAELSQQIEKFQAAIELYAKAQAYYKAAVLSEKIGDLNHAGDYYVLFNDFINAIRCYISGRNYEKANELLNLLIEKRRLELKKNNLSEDIDNIIRSYKNKAAELLAFLHKYKDAADLFMQIGDRIHAAQMFSLAGEKEKAFNIYVELSLYLNALEEYEKSGNTLNIDSILLAGLYSRAGNNKKAAELYEASEKYKEAASEYEKSGDIQNAARLHNLDRNPLKASEILLENGDVDAAINTLASSGRYKDAAATAEKFGAHLSAAQYYETVKNWQKAAEMYKIAGHYQNAAELLLKFNERKKAFEIYRNHTASFDNSQIIREMLIEGGDFSKAADISLTLNDKKKAAELYEKNGEYLKAASLWVELENNDLAADAYVKSNEPEKAAHYYEKAGKWNKAGECYLNLLKYNKAAECFNSAGNYLQAAQIYYNLKNLDRTINMLQKIQKDKAEYRQAAFLLGKIFHQQKFYNLAKIKLNESISDDAVNSENIEAYYIMADCHSKLGEFADGIKLYDLILSFDFNYRDVLPLRELALKDKSELKQIESHYEETGVIRDLLQLQEGDIISKRFKIEKEIGSGGMGKVYKAFDSELEETVAIKILFTQFGEYEDEKKNLVNEIKIARKITHPSVIKVYDIGDWLGNKFFTMQYIDGIDLGEWFQINLQADVKEKAVLFKKICEGLKAAHDIGVIHRDIKPRNILVNKDNNPMLLDFGIAEAFNAYLRITENKLIGSPDYMSPEQISNLAYDQRTDIYSLGCVMYEMFTGRKPYISEDLTHLFMAKLDHDPRPPSVFNPEIPTELEKIITKAMQKNPKNRYSNIAEMISDINLFLAT
jgi:hypothetical protein